MHNHTRYTLGSYQRVGIVFTSFQKSGFYYEILHINQHVFSYMYMPVSLIVSERLLSKPVNYRKECERIESGVWVLGCAKKMCRDPPPPTDIRIWSRILTFGVHISTFIWILSSLMCLMWLIYVKKECIFKAFIPTKRSFSCREGTLTSLIHRCIDCYYLLWLPSTHLAFTLGHKWSFFRYSDPYNVQKCT